LKERRVPTIIRLKHGRAPFVVIDRRVLEDERLTWAARGVLGYLLAKPDDWQAFLSHVSMGRIEQCAAAFTVKSNDPIRAISVKVDRWLSGFVVSAD